MPKTLIFQYFQKYLYLTLVFERPSVQELLELVKNFKINCIIVKDFSRFGRNSLDVGYFVEQVFPLFKVRFISINDNFDTINYNGDTGGMEFAFKNLINEYYSIDLSKKSKTAKYIKMQAGEYQSKICCFGYKKSADNRLEVDQPAADIVKMIFEMALAGKSNIDIVKILRKKNIITPGEYKVKNQKLKYDISKNQGLWHSSAITRILTDERYTGTYVIGKRTVKAVGSKLSKLKNENDWIKIPEHHTAIISKEDFEKVQKIRKTHKSQKKKKNNHALKGKVICGCCNHNMERRSVKNSYFLCRHSLADETLPCYGMRINENELYNLLFDIISKQTAVLLNSDNIDSVKRYDTSIQEKLNYENLIKNCYENKCRLYEKLMLEEIDLQMYNELKSEYDNKINDLKQTLSDITLQTELLKTKKEQKTTLINISEIVSKEQKFNQALSDLLIDKVFVYPHNRVEIVWKVQNFV